MARVSIISVFFDCDKFLPGFFENITQQSCFDSCELIYLRPDQSPGNEKTMAGMYRLRYPEHIKGIWTSHDPGLYELWNLGIQTATGEYITNANPDDRRAPEHIAKAVAFLDAHPEFDICATAIACTEDPLPNWENSPRAAAWYTELGGEFRARDLFALNSTTGEVSSRNLPHCMPVWRKSLHDRFGFFEESAYGPSADWEFWLRCLSGGARGWLIDSVLGLYYINPESYWRVNRQAKLFDDKIIQKYEGLTHTPRHVNTETETHDSSALSRRINLGAAATADFGRHRHGWAAAIQALNSLHHDNGVLLEPFIEKKFHFGTDPGDFHSDCPMPYTQPWVGFLHCTEDTPEWFGKWLKPTTTFSTDLWKDSLPYCKGLFTLSSDLAEWLRDCGGFNVPVERLLHPTEFDVPKFSWEAFAAERRVIQIGEWARKLNAIYFLRSRWKKILLRKSSGNDLRELEACRFGYELSSSNLRSVEVLDTVNDAAYDDLLRRSVVFCNLYTTAANNIVLECISRCTPLLVNRLPATVEYLGKEYPLLFSDLTEASLLLNDLQRVRAAHEYLVAMDKRPFTYQSFCRSVHDSQIYQSLPLGG